MRDPILANQKMKTIEVSNLEELDAFAARLASLLTPGDVLALSGPMGSGKTTFTQHLGRHLGIDEKITSPTFVLIHDYLSGSVPLVHVDFYRLGEEDANSLSSELLGVLEDRSAVVVVEWAEYGSFLEPYISMKIAFEPIGDDENRRQITMTGLRPELTTVLQDL